MLGLEPIAKFNDRQYFRLYGKRELVLMMFVDVMSKCASIIIFPEVCFNKLGSVCSTTYIYLSHTCQLNDYYSSVFGGHVCKHRQNQFMPQESLGVLGTNLYMGVDQTLFPTSVSLASETMLTCLGELVTSFVVVFAEDCYVHAYSFFKCVLLLHGRGR